MSNNKLSILIIYQDCIEIPDFLLSESTLGLFIYVTKSSDTRLIDELSDEVDICLLWCWNSPGKIFDILKCKDNLKWIHTIWTGIDELDLNNCNKKLLLTNSSGVSSRALAEFALGSSLYFLKRLSILNTNKVNKKWAPVLCDKLQDMNVGILGYGSIGREVENLFTKLCNEIYIYTNRSITQNKINSYQLKLDEILITSDIIICCLPLTNVTKNLIDAHNLSLLKKNSIFINLSRGKIICEKSLISLLKEGKIMGAALDVFNNEPLTLDNSLWDIENLIISPHSADKTKDKYFNYANVFMHNLELFLANKELNNLIDFNKGY